MQGYNVHKLVYEANFLQETTDFTFGTHYAVRNVKLLKMRKKETDCCTR